jgi:Domain of unknown function (DUF4345)
MEIFNLVVLVLSGSLLTFAGATRLFKPLKSLCLQTNLQRHGDDVTTDADMLSEMRGAGMFTALSGLALLGGAAMPSLRPVSLVVGIVIFLGYAVGRTASMVIDGKPGKDTVGGLFSEALFSALLIVCLVTLPT